MDSKTELVKQYFHLVEQFNTDPEVYRNILHPEILQIEYPNLITREIQTHSYDSLISAMESGKKLLSRQSFDLLKIFDCSDSLIVELKWTGEIGADRGNFTAGQLLTAHICTVFEFKDGKIFSQRNYDCYEAF